MRPVLVVEAVAQSGGVVWAGGDHSVMGQNFVGCDREQELLLPPSLREWLPEGHLAWFVIDAVEAMDPETFYASYRADGHGRAALDSSMMLALFAVRVLDGAAVFAGDRAALQR